MKVLQIHNKYVYYGGEDTVVDEEANLLNKNNHKVTQVFRDNKKELISFKDKFKAALNLSYSKDSIRILEKKLSEIKKPDIAHIHNIFPLWTNSIFQILNEKKIPIIMTLHNYRLVWESLRLFKDNYIDYGCYKNSKIKTFLISKMINRKKKLLKNVDKFIALTEFAQQEYIKSGINSNRLVIKPNFLSQKKISFQSISNKKNAIFASRISKEKGILTLINSWKNIETKIDIYGDGPLLNKLKNNKKNIEFHGNCSRNIVSDKIKKSKFLIYPSEWYECMPMTILESFREGTLVLASNLGSIKSIIKDNYNGVLFNPRDPKDIIRKVNWVLNNPKKCDEICLNAMDDFNKNYSEEQNYKQLIGIYKEVITNYKK
jgi:glycosyltransferase involved in cell wall biosynthesis